MDRLETKRILEFLDANYDLLSGKTDEQVKIIIWSWYEVVRPYSFNDVLTACKNYISNSRTKPKPSDIKSELDVMKAERHSVHKQIEKVQDLDGESRLTRQKLQDLFNREYAPFLSMNLPESLKENLMSKHNQENIERAVSKVWNLIHEAEFKVMHAEMAFASVRGTKPTFNQFMKALVDAHSHDEEMKSNPDILEAYKQSFNGYSNSSNNINKAA